MNLALEAAACVAVSVLTWFGKRAVGAPKINLASGATNSLGMLLFYVVTSITIAPLVEEAVFRWLWWNAIGVLPLWLVIGSSTVAFAWLHGRVGSKERHSTSALILAAAPQVVTSLWLWSVFLRGGYLDAVIGHALFNGYVMGVLVLAFGMKRWSESA